jgi:hypothetical protein
MNVLNDHERIPWLAWPSMLSLDAVMVAMVWQQLLMRAFCHRGSTWPEAGSLGATVWLIYVADRLLDAARLNLYVPHTLRHGFHLRHRKVFLPLWIVVLAINAFVVTHYLPHELLRGGLLLASAVLIYGASVHFSPLRSHMFAGAARRRPSWRHIPKEVRVGFLFALGVSLSVWTELFASGEGWQNMGPLAITTCVLTVLFGCNCMLVARFERELDRAQSFASMVTANPKSNGSVGSSLGQSAVILMMVLPVVLMLLPIPLPILLTIVMSAAGLSVIALGARRTRPRAVPHHGHARFDIRGAWVDAAVWMPPLMILLLGLR